MITTIFQFLGKLFITNPYVALIPAIFFGLFYFKSKNKLIFITTVLWLLYMIYEELHLLRIICSGECNIRIDLLLIYPILIVLSIIAIFIIVKSVYKKTETV